jgi:hypothetical protein
MKNKQSLNEMNITPVTYDSLRQAIKQASEYSKCSDPIDRLKSAENMCKRRTYDFLTLKLEDDEEEEVIEDNDETISNITENNSKLFCII